MCFTSFLCDRPSSTKRNETGPIVFPLLVVITRTRCEEQKTHFILLEMSASSDDEDDTSKKPRGSASRRSINELLRNALLEASVPGTGDEEPEVLEAPGGRETHGRDNPEETEAERMERERLEAKHRAIVEEERRVAELSFDAHALLPCEQMEERAKYIPMRLTYEERKNLRMVIAAINVSDYTNSVDVAFKNKAKRRHLQLQYIVAFMSGLVVATKYEHGQAILSDRNFAPFERDIQNKLEIARRYKVTNPEKMRSEYGKLVYLMQDANSSETKQLVGVEINKPILTVNDVLRECGALAMLADPNIATATQEILAEKKSRHTIQLEIKRKER